MKKYDKLLDVLGWIGTALILIGYGLFTTGIVPDVIVYHCLNLTGSIGVAAISYHRKVWQPVVINVTFSVFALIAIIRHFLW
jgi:hypothetical protein